MMDICLDTVDMEITTTRSLPAVSSHLLLALGWQATGAEHGRQIYEDDEVMSDEHWMPGFCGMRCISEHVAAKLLYPIWPAG